MSRSAQHRVASGIVTTILVAVSFALLASYRGAGPVSADKGSGSPGDSGASKGLADIDVMPGSADIAAAATSYIELMESNPSALTQVFEERIQAVEGSIADDGISSAELTGLLDALPSVSSADTGAGAYATLRLRETVLSELAQRDANTAQSRRAAIVEDALASLWEFQTDPYAYLLAAKAVQLSEEAGAEQAAALVQEFEDYLATAGTNMAAFAVRARMMERYESLENWTARNGSAQGLAADGDAQFLQDALASEAVPPELKAGVIRALASAQLLIGDTESALSTLDSADEFDPAVGAESVPPAALLNAPEEALSTKSTVSPNSKAAPSMPEHLPLAEQIGILDTQNPVLRFRMREPGMELPGDPALAADQRIVEVFPHPVFYPDEDDGGRLKPINIELSEGTQSDGSTAWEEERNTLKYRGDSRGRQFYRVGEYRLRMAPLFAGSENAASSALRQRLASQPSAVARSGGGGLAAEGILGDGVVFLHDAAPGHVKEFVTLPSQPALPSAAAHWLLAYRWEAEGLAPEISGDEVVWKNSSGETIFRLPPPVAWDANGDPLAVSYRLRGNVVGLVVPAEALRGAAYPVVLDPTVTTGSSDISANLSPWYKISGMHAHKGMYARFALPDLTGFTSITQATFNAKILDTLGSSVATAAYCEVESAWTESSGHAVLDAFSFSGATVTQGVTATSGWVSWDILGTTGTTGIAHIYAGDASPDPATVKIAATAYTNAPTGKTNGLALAYYDGGIYREFYGRTASSGNVPYIQIVYSQATPPTANFSADVTTGGAPLEVAFTDTSNGNGSTITAWSWNFGDGNTSTSQSPTHEYTTPGTYTVSLTVTTASGSDGETKTNYIDVDDVTPPAITLLGDNPVDTPLGGTYTDVGATALDAHEGNLTAEIVVGGDTVDSETLGEYVITYDVSDSANNHAEQVTRTVHVVDMTPPVITLLGGNPLDIHLGGAYSEPGATASDNVDGDLTSSITVGGDTVDVETAGVYSVTYNVTDGAGNAAEEVVREVRIWPSLEIEVEGTGGTSPLPAQTHFFAPGSTVELYGFADNVDHIFDEWTGDAVADSDSAVTTILMDGPKSVTANFVEGHSVVTGVASGLGAIEAVPNKPIYPDGAEVAFTATPENGYEFDHWVTDGTLVSGAVNDPAITLELSADANLVAHFNQLSYTLSVSTTGEGDVSPASASYHYGDPLSLTATPDSGWHFAYWTGGLDGTDSVKNLTVTGNITATAVFVEDFTLTVNTQGEGGVSPGGGTYIPGDPVSLTATAGSGWRFDHWEGDFDSQANPLNFPMQDDYTVMAVFVEDPYLTVSTIGEGTVALSPTQPPEGYAPSTNVTLTAMPASGWFFDGWSGALSGNDNPESVTTPATSEIVAEFREATTLTITKTGSGTGTVQVSDAMRTYSANPNGTYTVPMGAELALTPSATSGCFYCWSGDVTGSYSPGMLTVTGNHAITAEFGMKSTLELTVIGEGSITLDPPQPPGGYCPGTEIQVTAVPDTDWVFNKWGGALPNLEWAPSQTLVTTPGPSEIVAYLAERPGIGGLNLLEDLGAYLVAIGEYTDPEEVDGFDYDFGEEDLEELETVYTPNGIPDAAEMVALQAVLENPSIEVEDGGVSHMAVWKIYLANLAQAEADLSTQSEAIQRAVATYMTLGTIGHQGKIADDVQTHFGATLDFSLYRNAGGRWFGANKDMDQDGVTNKSASSSESVGSFRLWQVPKCMK